MRMGKRNPMSWTQRLKRLTGHPNALNLSDANKNTTKVVVEPEDIVLDTNDTSQKRYATIEREGRKQASNPSATQPGEDNANVKKPLETPVSSPPPVCPRPDVGQTSANIEKEPVGPSASSPAVAPRPDERNPYVSVKKHRPNDAREDDDDDYTDVCNESGKPIAGSPPAVAVRSDDRPYVSVKKYPTNVMNVTSTVEPAYVDKDATAVCVTSTEAPDYVDVKPDGGDVTSSAHEKTVSTGYVVVEPGSSENTTEQRAADAEPSGYVDVTQCVGESNPATQSAGSSDTVLRGRAGRQHDSVTGKDDDSGKDARAGLKTWANEKAGAANDKEAERNCMTYVSVVGNKGTTLQEAPDSTAYLSIVPNATGLSGADAEQPGYVDLTSGVREGNPTTQSGGSSDTLLRGRAGRQHDSLTGKDDDSGKDARAGLKTWANRPEKAGITNDKAYVSVLGDKGTNTQGTTDCATYISVVPAV